LKEILSSEKIVIFDKEISELELPKLIPIDEFK
jgi:hypothetical protein